MIKVKLQINGKKRYRLLVKKAVQADMTHRFTQPHQNYNKIQNSHHSELSEFEFNESLTNTELEKLHLPRLVGRVQTHRTGWSLTHV